MGGKVIVPFADRQDEINALNPPEIVDLERPVAFRVKRQRDEAPMDMLLVETARKRVAGDKCLFLSRRDFYGSLRISTRDAG
jgi:hypothetical protein